MNKRNLLLIVFFVLFSVSYCALAVTFGYDTLPYLRFYDDGTRAIDLGGNFYSTPNSYSYSSYANSTQSDTANVRLRLTNIFARIKEINIGSGFDLSYYDYSYQSTLTYTSTSYVDRSTSLSSTLSLAFILSAEYKFHENISVYSILSLLSVSRNRSYYKYSSTDPSATSYSYDNTNYSFRLLQAPTLFSGVRIYL